MKQQGLDQRWECKHERTEIRERTLRNGSKHLIPQCLVCGQTAGTAVRRDSMIGPVKPYDEGMERETIGIYDRIKEIESQEFWRWYNAYLNSPEWQSKRLLVLKRDNHTCQGCGGPGNQVHHRTYEHVGEEFLFQLMTLCDRCHKRWHGESV